MLRKFLVSSFRIKSASRTITTSLRSHNKSNEAEDYTHFGYETVKTTEKAEKGKFSKCFDQN